MDPREAGTVNPEGHANWERREHRQCQSVCLEEKSIGRPKSRHLGAQLFGNFPGLNKSDLDRPTRRGAAYLVETAFSNRPVPYDLACCVLPPYLTPHLQPSSCSSPPPTAIDIRSHIQLIILISLHSNTVSATFTLWPTRTVARASTPTPLRRCAPSRPRRRRPRRLALRHPRPSQTSHSRPHLILRRSAHITLRRTLWSTHHRQSPKHTPFRTSHRPL